MPGTGPSFPDAQSNTLSSKRPHLSSPARRKEVMPARTLSCQTPDQLQAQKSSKGHRPKRSRACTLLISSEGLLSPPPVTPVRSLALVSEARTCAILKGSYSPSGHGPGWEASRGSALRSLPMRAPGSRVAFEGCEPSPAGGSRAHLPAWASAGGQGPQVKKHPWEQEPLSPRKGLLRGEQCAEWFTCITSFNPHIT